MIGSASLHSPNNILFGAAAQLRPIYTSEDIQRAAEAIQGSDRPPTFATQSSGVTLVCIPGYEKTLEFLSDTVRVSYLINDLRKGESFIELKEDREFYKDPQEQGKLGQFNAFALVSGNDDIARANQLKEEMQHTTHINALDREIYERLVTYNTAADETRRKYH